MTRMLLGSAMMGAACAPCPAADPAAVDSSDTGTPADDALTTEELDALDTWTERTVSLTPVEGKDAVEGNRISILLEQGTVERLDLATSLTRAQDHNSSRSNKTASIAAPDDLSFAWDGRDACVELPCASDERPEGAVSALTVDAGAGALSVRWGETTAMDESFSGYLALGCKGCSSGHVNVLRAAATDDGSIVITSALESSYVAIFLDESPVYEGAPMGGMTPLATVRGVTGASWPSVLSVEATALGTLISLGW